MSRFNLSSTPANSGGSFKCGSRKRWLTDFISTAQANLSPSCFPLPNPVMLLIIAWRISCAPLSVRLLLKLARPGNIRARKLQIMETPINATFAYQVGMRSCLTNSALVDDNYFAGLSNRGKSVGNDENRASLHQVRQS